ncbi:hypothetical protein BaRGS_00014951 [Batillaria attramentaria]|uniref:Uncharacterized protein n=1 Tax=Batillaria attramentaria TaxID=370345 RepID=A0ABD0L3W4_9CAEN
MIKFQVIPENSWLPAHFIPAKDRQRSQDLLIHSGTNHTTSGTLYTRWACFRSPYDKVHLHTNRTKGRSVTACVLPTTETENTIRLQRVPPCLSPCYPGQALLLASSSSAMSR